MSTASVATIYRYPVKSMMGETLSEAISERPAYRVIAAGRFGMRNVVAFGGERKSRN